MIEKKMPLPSDGTFTDPEKLPAHEDDTRSWQYANKSFWEQHSMRYDWDTQIPHDEFSKEFYQEIDRRFFGAIREVLTWKHQPFEQWIPFEDLKECDVLEIGVGNGSHAQLIAPWTRSYTGIDLTAYATKSTSTRLQVFGIPGRVLQMDAEKMIFDDASFDLVWSWGVIHHSANTDRILDEIRRVLRPGGRAIIMVYYRGWYSYYIAGLLHGLFKGHFFRGKTLHQAMQASTDGALARFYTFRSWKNIIGDRFTVQRVETFGGKADFVLLPAGRIKNTLLRVIPGALALFGLKNLRMGTFLVCSMTKK